MKVGIVGCAEGVARAERALVESGQQVAATADTSSELLGDLLAGSPWIRSPAEGSALALAPSVEAIAIATREVGLRAPLASEALHSGRHVLVFGTTGCDAREAEQLEALARRSERGLLAAAPDPHGEAGARLLALARELDPPRLITLRRRLDRSAQEAILDLLAADLALLQELVCAAPDWVSATTLRERADAPILGFALTLHHPGGALAQIEIELGAETARFELTAQAGQHRIALAGGAGGRPRLSLDGEPLFAQRACAAHGPGLDPGAADLAARFVAGVEAPGAPLLTDAQLPEVRVLEALRASMLRGGRAIELAAAPMHFASL